MFVFIAIMLACLVKAPLVPFHAWLPLAYYEAPAPVTALMAGALSKMGAYGILKLALPLAPDVAVAAGPAMATLAVASLLYGAVLALREEDYKKLVAYSSLSHMGYVVLGLFTLREAAIHGALLQMLSHGVAVAGLFALLGMLEQRLGPSYRHATALATAAPRFAIWLMLFVLTTLALPLTSGFTAEFLILFGAFAQGLAAWQAHAGMLPLIAALLAMTGMVLGATYMLRFARAILFGTGAGAGAHRIADLRPVEAASLLPLLLVILVIGIAPAAVMSKVQSVAAQIGSPHGK
jgi:NADH-quinone oxidoreductase subunit M